jgi:radical SAM superfamily enzyme YgiQ (UPF0313 family)
MSFKRILLVKPSGRHGLSFAFDIIPTGLEYIAAYIEDVVDKVDVIDLEMEQPKPFDVAMTDYLDDLKPDLVGISMSATEHTEGLELARLAKERGIATVLGGYHPTAIPDELLTHPQVDMVVRGEGEQTMRELVIQGYPKGIDGIFYKENGKVIKNPERAFIKDLDSMPLPARHLRRYKYYLTLAKGREHDVLTTSRGCWGGCSFCCEPTISKSRQRYRSPENVVSEILEIYNYHKGKPLSIEITDPHFIGKPRLVDKLCDMLAEHKLDIEFIAKVRPDSMARHPDTVRKMVSVGILGFEMGIESPNQSDLKSTSKGLKSDVHIRAVENILKAGGTAGGSFVIGLLDHTEEEIMQFPIYAKKLGLLSSAFAVATPFPDTKFYDELNEAGLIFETDWNRFDEMHSVFKTRHLSSERIHELASYCMAKFWTIDTFLEKERRSMMRQGRKQHLFEFIGDKVTYLKFGAGAGVQVHEGNYRNNVEEVMRGAVEPDIRAYTERIGVQDIIEMDGFLRKLGPQKIQITISSRGVKALSLIVKTTKTKVEYIETIADKVDDSTINFDMELNDFNLELPGPMRRRDKIRIFWKAIASNKGFKKQFNLMRLFYAVGSEAIGRVANKGL